MLDGLGESGPYRALRDEAPLYRNEKYTFWALTRYDDVEKALVDWDLYRSGKGSTLEMILSGQEMPAGSILMEDPPVERAVNPACGLMTRSEGLRYLRPWTRK